MTEKLLANKPGHLDHGWSLMQICKASFQDEIILVYELGPWEWSCSKRKHVSLRDKWTSRWNVSSNSNKGKWPDVLSSWSSGEWSGNTCIWKVLWGLRAHLNAHRTSSDITRNKCVGLLWWLEMMSSAKKHKKNKLKATHRISADPRHSNFFCLPKSHLYSYSQRCILRTW